MTDRVLVVEDDRDVANLLADGLRDLADRVEQANDGPTGLAMAESADYALVVLDLVLPRLGGPKICALLKSAGSDSSILAVTGRADLVAGLLGTQFGFDDYVLKPFDLRDVRDRASRLLERRRRSASPPSTVPIVHAEAASVTIDAAAKRVLIEGKPVEGLSLKEYEVVAFLARNPGVAFSKEELLAAVWRIHHPVHPRHLGIDMARLREKLTGSRSSYLSITHDERYRLL